MIYIKTGSDDAFFNFAAEHYYMSRTDEPFFMLWKTRPTLMVGKYQNIYEEINVTRAQQAGIVITRRYSGGGTIYTDGGCVQFSYFFPGSSDGTKSFGECCADVVEALKRLGANAEYSSRNDLYVDGKKVCGNARYVNSHGLLHHGSLLFSADLSVMPQVLTVSEEKIRSKGIKSVAARVDNIANHINGKMTTSEFIDYLADSIPHSSEYSPTDAEREQIESSVETDFASWDFVYGKNPEFELEYSHRFAGGLVKIKLNTRHGIISDASISGDFFYDGDINALCAGLSGTKFDRDEVLRVLCAHDRFFAVTPRELADMIF